MPTESDAPRVADLGASALRKVTWRLIPFLFLLYIIAWLDRVNVGFAALQMNAHLKFSDSAFGFGSGVFFVGYCLFEVPSNLVLARVGARLWISRIMITWGTISVAMMFVRTPTHFYILRFLLGAAEAGFFPGVIYYLSLWYPETERARAIARFMTAVPVSGLIGGPLSGLLLKLNGTLGLGGWQWLFLVEGLPAIILGVVVLFYLPDHPENAHWLTRAERDALGGSQSDRLTRPSGGSPDGSYAERDTRRPSEAGSFTSETSILRALTSSVIWQLGIIFLLAAMAFYGYSFWAPLVIKSLTGVSDLGVGLIAGAISAATIVFMLANGAHSDRTDEQPIHTAVALAMMALGCVGCAIFQAPVLGILSLALIPIGHCSAYGPFWSMPSRFLTGRAAAAGTALVVTIANVGGFLGPSLMGYLKQRSGTHTLAFLLLAAFGIMAALLAYALRRSPALAPK